VSADFGDVSHTLNGQPQNLDTTHSTGHSSEVGIRFRGVLTRKLFYGAQASWFLLSLEDQLKLSSIVNSHAQDRATGSSFAVGLGYAIRPRIVFTLDLAGDFPNTTTMRTEDATGNLLERNHSSSPFLSAHEAVQADVWRRMFVSGSLLTVRQTVSTNLTLYPDQFGRLLLPTVPLLRMASQATVRQTIILSLERVGGLQTIFSPSMFFRPTMALPGPTT